MAVTSRKKSSRFWSCQPTLRCWPRTNLNHPPDQNHLRLDRTLSHRPRLVRDKISQWGLGINRWGSESATAVARGMSRDVTWLNDKWKFDQKLISHFSWLSQLIWQNVWLLKRKFLSYSAYHPLCLARGRRWGFGEFPRLVGRYCSYLLPKQAGGTPQIIIFKTLGQSGW